MAQEKKPASTSEPTTEIAEQQEKTRMRREIETLKQQLAGTAKRETLPVKHETTNPEQASVYGEAGGILVSITKLYPGTMKSGKRYGFAQTKEELDALVSKMKQEVLV